MKEYKVRAVVREAIDSDREDLAVLRTDLADEHLDGIGIVLDTKPVLPEHAVAILQFMRGQGASFVVAVCDSMLAGILLVGHPEASAGTRYSGLTMAAAGDYRCPGVGSALLLHAQALPGRRGHIECPET